MCKVITTAKTQSVPPLLERLDQIEQRVSRLEMVQDHHPNQHEFEKGESRDELPSRSAKGDRFQFLVAAGRSDGVVRSQLTDWPELPGSTWIGPMEIVGRVTSYTSGVGLAFTGRLALTERLKGKAG